MVSENGQTVPRRYSIALIMDTTSTPPNDIMPGTSELDPALCYRIMLARDSRFDGRFFTAVKTTGIYCRPICPTPAPKRENCEWYLSAAAAQGAGFRPCIRCRPEHAPGLDVRHGDSLVARALGLLEEHWSGSPLGVRAIAARLGVSERTLHRSFRREIGASPKEFEDTRQTLFAKELIVDSSLSMTDIAFAAGYGSVRRFNASFKGLFQRPPSLLRREASQRHQQGIEESGIVLRLPYREPYHFPSIFQFLEQRAIPGVESVVGGEWRRVVSIGESTGVVAVRDFAEKRYLEARVAIDDLSKLAAAKARISRIFDVDADAAKIDQQLSTHAFLTEDIRSRPGVRIPGVWDGFEICIRAILGQQISVVAARTLAGRIAAKFGKQIEDLPGGDGLTCAFPTPEELSGADFEGLGIMPARAETIRSVAQLLCEEPALLTGAWPSEEARARLLGIRGIGPWTASYIALRALNDPDAYPERDLGLMQALAGWGDAVANAWRPWRGYAAIRIWTLPQPSVMNKASSGAVS